MRKIRELDVKERNELRKKNRNTDIIRKFEKDSWYEPMLGGHCETEKEVCLYCCSNYEMVKYWKDDKVKAYEIEIDGKIIGVAEVVGSIWKPWLILSFEEFGNEMEWGKERVESLFNEKIDIDIRKCKGKEWKWIEGEEKQLWKKEKEAYLFEKHLEFNDEIIAYNWRILNNEMTVEQISKYACAITNLMETGIPEQKRRACKEIAYTILPKYTENNLSKIEEECVRRLISDAYKMADIENNLLVQEENFISKAINELRKRFEIDTLEKAKEYYIDNECSKERYKDCYVPADYEEIMNSFEKWDVSCYEKEWKKEAFDKKIRSKTKKIEWNIVTMLELLKEVDAEQVEKLKNYIEDKKADIVERDIVLHCLKQAKEHFKGKKDIYQQLGQCCEMLEDRFEFRQLTEEEEEKFRKGRNAREYYKKKIYVYPHRYLVIDEGNTSSRFYPSFSGPFANEESKCWSLGANEPKFYTVWENYRYVGRIEVASNKNIWKIYGSDKEKAYKIFERYVRQIGLIATEEKIGYLSEQERQEQEKTIYKQQQLGELRSIWYNPTAWLDSWQSATGDWKKEITKIILESYRSIDEEEMRCYRGKIMALHLVYTVLPNMLENEALYCKEHLEYLEYFLRKSIKIQYGIDCELLEALNVKSLLELYKPFFKIDTKEKAREFYEFNHSRQDILRYDRIETIPKALWENFQNFNS